MIIVNPTRKETGENFLFFQFLEIQLRKSMKSFQYSNLLKQSESYVGPLLFSSILLLAVLFFFKCSISLFFVGLNSPAKDEP